MPSNADLHVAIISGNYNTVSECVKSKELLHSTWRGGTPVSFALYLRKYEILNLLVKSGANVNTRTKNDRMEPPLFAACRLSDMRAITILLQSINIDVDQRDFYGRTALWAAIRYSTKEAVQLLLDHNADIRIAKYSFECRSFLDMFKSKDSRVGILQLLIRRGCEVNMKCLESSLLRLAVKYADRKTFCLLVSAGCKVGKESWLSTEQLPSEWRKDESFIQWIHSLQSNPSSLLHLSRCVVRKLLIEKWKNLQYSHVQQLNLPKQLKCSILLEDQLYS